MRTLGVIAFIVAVAAVAGFAATHTTIARGNVLAADLLRSNAKVLAKLTCDDEIPIGIAGATFWCDATFVQGPPRRLHFELARTGAIKQIGWGASRTAEPAPRAQAINKSDPWE